MHRQSEAGDDDHGTVANEQEVKDAFGTTSDGRSVAERSDVNDEDGDNVREYSGEPVPTEDGYVIPRQSAVGSQRAGDGGEWQTDPGKADADTAHAPNPT
ncbi:hypothetical protein [Ilumatobacter sp.]|uniref:hypothetical protein n=1 Tax=Ilumatobacter sp. TaxID=1967498 RepID=UPI003B5181B4